MKDLISGVILNDAIKAFPTQTAHHWPWPWWPLDPFPTVSFWTVTISQATSFYFCLLRCCCFFGFFYHGLSLSLSLPLSRRFGIDFSQLMKLKRQRIVCGVAHGDEFSLRVHDTGFRGEFLWGGLNRSPLSLPPPLLFASSPAAPASLSPLLPCLSDSQET